MKSHKEKIFILIITMAYACTGPREKTTASFSAQNDSDHPLMVKIDLDDSSAADECENSSRSKTFTVAPHSFGDGEVSMRCGYGPNVRIDAVATRSDTGDRPQGYAYSARVKLRSTSERISSIRIYVNAQTEPLDIPITEGGQMEFNGLPSDAKLEDAFAIDFTPYFGPVARATYDNIGNVRVVVTDKYRGHWYQR
jgi:hypothetical protein